MTARSRPATLERQTRGGRSTRRIQDSSKPGLDRSVWLWELLLVVITVAAYYPAMSHPFVNYDDGDYVSENRHVQQGLSFSTAEWAMTSTTAGNWHPITWLSHAVDCDLFGLDPAGHHFTSVLLHALNAGLLFLLLFWATERRVRSFVVAAIFALHPINVESVAWVAERKTVLSMFFFLMALGAYGWFAARPNFRRYSMVFIFSVLALASKPMVVTLPFAFLLLDFWPLQRVSGFKYSESKTNTLPQLSLRQLVFEKIPLLFLCAASSVATIIAQRRAIKDIAAVPFTARLSNAIFSYVAYLWKAIWPLHLGVFYAHCGADLKLWQIALCLLTLAIITILVWNQRGRGYPLVGWLWYLGTLVPMIGLVQAGEQGMADRYAYLPFLGIFVIAVWSIADLGVSLHWHPRILGSASATILILSTVLTHRQLRSWESSFALWTHSLEVTSQNYTAEDFVGSALLDQGYESTGQSCSDDALQHFERAISINPRDTMGHLNVGFCWQARGEISEAISQYQAALDSSPNKYLKSRAYLNLGAGYDALGDFSKSHEFLTLAAQLYPRDPDIQAGMAQLEGDEKIAALVASLRDKPSSAGFVNLGRLQQQMGHAEDARHAFQRALELDSKSAEARAALSEVPKDRH
jgi:protein O-mannosyl-transferase